MTRVFDTGVDEFVRDSGETRKRFARQTGVSTSTLYKARALNPEKGCLHITSVVLIALRMKIIKYGEQIDINDPRLNKVAPPSMRTLRGRAAPNF